MSFNITKSIFTILLTIVFSIQTIVSLCQEAFTAKHINGLEWRHIGPFRGGRSCAIIGVSSRPETFLMGTTGGGIWKTKDTGLHWENISDGFFGGSIGAIEVASSDPNIIWVGEGEQTIRGNVSPGKGIWKSDDGGKNWVKMGLDQTRHIVRIKCHPKNPDIVLVAALGNVFKSHPDRGIFKTTDGGKSWKKVLFVNDSTGAAELCFDPVNPRIVFATTWNMRRSAHQMSSGGPGSGLWLSTDGGDHWKNISSHEGLPTGIWGISTVAVAPSNNDVIYAMIENENGGLFRSNDAGKTWKLVNSERKIRQRAWYFSRICIHPKNPDEVYALNVSLHKSTDGGKTFNTVNTQHADHHDMWFNPEQPNYIAVANDGGGQISDDNGKHWSPQNNQPTAQFYRVTTDNHHPFRIYVAQQDNSTIRIHHRTEGYSIGANDWEPTAGGESGHIAIDPMNPEIVYGGSYGGYLNRYDHQRNISRSINVWPDNPLGHGAEKLKYRFQWNFPLFFSPHKPTRLYAASNHLHVSEDEGNSWRTISPDLTRNDSSKMKASGGPITKDNTSVEYYCTIFAAAESPRIKDLLWIGTDDGLVHVSMNGGNSWTNVTPIELPAWTMINSIEPDPHQDGGCYLAATGYKNGDFLPYLFKTKDYGKTWKKITTGISSEHFTRVLRADPVRSGLLYSGTEYGIYVSLNDGVNWQSLQLNLPIVPITDLTVKEDFLIAATQGRSLWLIDDLGPLRQYQANSKNKKHILFQPKSVLRTDGGSTDSKFSGTNHPAGAILYFYIDSIQAKDSFSFFCIDSNKDTIGRWSNSFSDEFTEKIKLKSGCNKLEFSLRKKPAKSFDGMVLWWAGLQAAKPRLGNYKMYIQGPGLFDSTEIRVIRNKKYPTSDEDVEQQYQFIDAIRKSIDKAHKAIIEMRDIKKQLNDFCNALDKNSKTDSLFILKEAIDSTLNKIENELYQTKSKSNQDPINFPIKLTNKLAHLIALYEHGNYPPTTQAEVYRSETDELIQEQLKLYEDIKNGSLRYFNQKIREAELDFIKPKNVK
ncbi:MAG: glycosyl hydrolase [Saprospiraceae bacterium]|nr:glycosyl hydrolase [Saprospiraceae bacterium]